MAEWTVDQLAAQLQTLGVRRAGVLLVHTSYRAAGPVAGGPAGLICALLEVLGPEGTLVMPTMTDGESVFDPASTPSYEMGITAELFWRRPGVLRSDHPGASFAAFGPRAATICQRQPLSPPHGPDSPVGRVHELGGQVLLLGVTHSENTTLHLAEALAGVPYSVEHPCVVVRNGRVETLAIAETDHCSMRFRLADDWLRAAGLQREGPVGSAQARLNEARELVASTLLQLRAQPLLFLCATDSDCEECRAAHRSIQR